ncbi:hypothetical protein C8R46DRAFT_882627 [Mycena filopes]|nr:hypothetical protein C8R46DRAFT_882627 [Mycena filopes]
MDPVRADLQGFNLLKQVLPPAQWTSLAGISSLLVFMGTGQGTMTKEFLLGQPTMLFNSLQACVELFSRMENRAAQDSATAIKYENPSIYGQVNGWYSVHPSIRVAENVWRHLSILEKFLPYFSEELRNSWLAFLGLLANRDPATTSEVDAPRRSWEEVMRWIVHTNLSGFGTGLAPLQFANNVVLAGLAKPPSPAAMAQWIYANKSYGAFTGLRVLGFNLTPSSSPATVRAAFMCFYSWLDHHLSPSDKEVLRFNSIFVEQLLCKIGRWNNRLLSMARINLVDQARGEFEGCSWTSEANLTDHTQFPIPSCQGLSRTIFRRIIEEG